MAKTPVQNVDPRLKKNLAEKVKGQKTKISCQECGAGLGTWSVSGLGSGKNFTCKKCGEKTEVDTTEIREILGAIRDL